MILKHWQNRIIILSQLYSNQKPSNSNENLYLIIVTCSPLCSGSVCSGHDVGSWYNVWSLGQGWWRASHQGDNVHRLEWKSVRTIHENVINVRRYQFENNQLSCGPASTVWWGRIIFSHEYIMCWWWCEQCECDPGMKVSSWLDSQEVHLHHQPTQFSNWNFMQWTRGWSFTWIIVYI